jgi:hypothetical protein
MTVWTLTPTFFLRDVPKQRYRSQIRDVNPLRFISCLFKLLSAQICTFARVDYLFVLQP